MSDCTLLITITSCAAAAARRDACRRTWLAALPQGVRYAFYVGEGAAAEEPDCWQLPAPDGYAELMQKTTAALHRALELPGWAWLLDVDDDTAVDVPRVLAFLEGMDPARPVLCGHHGRVQPHRCLGGAGMLYSRAGARMVAEAADATARGVEDRLLTEAALRQGVAVEFSARWGYYGTPAPWLTDTRLTAVNMEPADMLSAWAARRPQAHGNAPAGIPPHLRPQGRSCATAAPERRRAKAEAALRRELAYAEQRKAAEEEQARRRTVAAQVLTLPAGVRRIVVLSNVVEGWPAERIGLRSGDLCLHINRAAHAAEAMAVEGAHHWLFCRHATARAELGWRWFTPAAFDGYARVLFIHDAILCRGMRWWAAWQNEHDGTPATTGFIVANICRELWPEVPLVLGGFEPGVYHGTPLWPGHAWQAEAEWYARHNFTLISPTP